MALSLTFLPALPQPRRGLKKVSVFWKSGQAFVCHARQGPTRAAKAHGGVRRVGGTRRCPEPQHTPVAVKGQESDSTGLVEEPGGLGGQCSPSANLPIAWIGDPQGQQQEGTTLPKKPANVFPKAEAFLGQQHLKPISQPTRLWRQ